MGVTATRRRSPPLVRSKPATLQGDLVVVGTGDPSLGAADGMADRVFAEWAERAEAARHPHHHRPHRRRRQRVRGRDARFRVVVGRSADDYAAGVGALQFNENAVRVTVTPGPAAGDSAAVSVAPGGSGLTTSQAMSSRARRRRRVDHHAPAAGQHDARAARLDPARRRPVDAGRRGRQPDDVLRRRAARRADRQRHRRARCGRRHRRRRGRSLGPRAHRW